MRLRLITENIQKFSWKFGKAAEIISKVTVAFSLTNPNNKQVKISDIISRRFGDFMAPLSRAEMRLKLTMRAQELQLIYIVEMVTQIL